MLNEPKCNPKPRALRMCLAAPARSRRKSPPSPSHFSWTSLEQRRPLSCSGIHGLLLHLGYLRLGLTRSLELHECCMRARRDGVGRRIAVLELNQDAGIARPTPPRRPWTQHSTPHSPQQSPAQPGCSKSWGHIFGVSTVSCGSSWRFTTQTFTPSRLLV